MNLYEQQISNRRKTWLLMAGFVVLFVFIGMAFDTLFFNYSSGSSLTGYRQNSEGMYEAVPSGSQMHLGLIAALLIAAGMSINGWLNGRNMVLRSSSARPVLGGTDEERMLLNVVSEISIAAGLPKPPVAYVVPDADLNAFASGIDPENSVIAVTDGLLKTLNREELQAVVAHEMSHIRNYDIRLMTIAAALLGAIALIGNISSRVRIGGGSRSSRSSGGNIIFFLIWLLLIIAARFAARALAMAVSRQREYLADASAAELTRNPGALISALEKIRSAVAPTTSINNGYAHMCIDDPQGGGINEKSGFVADLFSTHPPMEKRIQALREMSYQS